MTKFNPQPKSGPKPKNKPKPIKKSAIKYKKKDHTMIDVFAEIAEERDWICVATGTPLTQLKDTQFLHILPKALNKFPKFRSYKKNIVLATDEIHRKWDFAPRSELKKDSRFDVLFELEAELKEEYKQLYGK